MARRPSDFHPECRLTDKPGGVFFFTFLRRIFVMRTRSQRLLSMVLALSMLLTFLPVSAFAEGTPPPLLGFADA